MKKREARDHLAQARRIPDNNALERAIERFDGDGSSMDLVIV